MEKRQGYFSRAIKWAFNPKGHGPDSLRSLLAVNPLIFAAIVIITGGLGYDFWRTYSYSLLIGETVSLTCISSSLLLSLVGLRWLKIGVQKRTFILFGGAAMVPGLWLGFKVADGVFHYFGYEHSGHSYNDYSSGLMIGVIFLLFFSFMDMWFVAKRHAQMLETENLQAKLSALSAQMNPHLLFNALNTIASTIPSNPAAAEETTLKLSELYRGILASSKRVSHPLGLELDICRAYLGIETSRFGERLKWIVEVDPALEELEVPTLLIQPLVENAIKHGISQRAQGGKVSVQISSHEGLISIEVADDGIGYGNSRSTKGTGTGISSCRARLDLLYRGKSTFEIGPGLDGNGTRVKIGFPGKMGKIS